MKCKVINEAPGVKVDLCHLFCGQNGCNVMWLLGSQSGSFQDFRWVLRAEQLFAKSASISTDLSLGPSPN